MKIFYCFFLFFFIGFKAYTQDNSKYYEKNGLSHPDLLPLHHFGIFSSRISANFKQKPVSSNFQFQLKSANIFQPFVEAYLPKDPEVRQKQSQHIWYDRDFKFIDQQTTPADYMSIIIDAVIKEFKISYGFNVGKQHDIIVSLQSFLFTKGDYPFSFFTSDNTIEWFHSHIAGGEDPFGRRYYGLNEMHYQYTDRNGKQLDVKNNSFFINNFQINHHYYPDSKLKLKDVYLNFGSHLGINLSSFNPSVDIGFSANGIKKKTMKKNRILAYGFSLGFIKKNLINFGSHLDFGNNPFIGNFESQIELTKYRLNKQFHTWGLHYQLQTRYFQKKEASYYQLVGDWDAIHSGWHNGIATLYKNLTCWSLIYTFGNPKYHLSLYIQEDFLVHNAPDLQTGISLKYFFKP